MKVVLKEEGGKGSEIAISRLKKSGRGSERLAPDLERHKHMIKIFRK